MINLGAPEGWKSECGSIECYIEKQHPSRNARQQNYSLNTPISLTGWEWKKAILQDFLEYYRWLWGSLHRYRKDWRFVKNVAAAHRLFWNRFWYGGEK